MKKLIVLFSAVAALAACSKNEVVPAVSGENVEISYKVAPRTKADPQTFDTHNVFASWAYYLPNGKSWDANRTEAKEYISNSEISFNDGVWKDKDISHYWPNGGSLTFFAYSLNRNNLELKHETGHTYPIECHNENNAYGINATIDLKENKNLDLLVAEIASDKTQNENIYSLNGVPTLFKHKFSRIRFAVKKKEEYTGATITLNSITFNNVAHTGHYSQFNKEDGDVKFTQDYCKVGDIRTSLVYTTTDFKVTSATDYVPVTETDETYYIYMPQDFKNVTEAKNIATIEVKYTVTDKEGISKTYTKTLKVKDIFDSWKIGKRYTFNLMFSLNEINWAPAVGDWENEIKNIDIETGNSIPVEGNTTTGKQN